MLKKARKLQASYCFTHLCAFLGTNTFNKQLEIIKNIYNKRLTDKTNTYLEQSRRKEENVLLFRNWRIEEKKNCLPQKNRPSTTHSLSS